MNLEFDGTKIIIDGVTYVREEPVKKSVSKPMLFKVGDWIIGDSPTMNPYWPCRVHKIKDGFVHYSEDGSDYFQSTGIRLAMKYEIKDHLIQEAKRRGLIGKGLKIKDADDGLIATSDDCEYEYRPEYDSLVVASHGSKSPIHNLDYHVTNLYYQGKWAEIVPEKKKLPQTRDEYRDFIYKYDKSMMIGDDFLNDYF